MSYKLQIEKDTKRMKRRRQIGEKGEDCRRIIRTEYRDDGKRWELHATKGWRNYRDQVAAC